MGEVLQVVAALIFMGLGFFLVGISIIGGTQCLKASESEEYTAIVVIVGLFLAAIGAGFFYLAGVVMP